MDFTQAVFFLSKILLKKLFLSKNTQTREFFFKQKKGREAAEFFLSNVLSKNQFFKKGVFLSKNPKTFKKNTGCIVPDFVQKCRRVGLSKKLVV